MRQNPRVSDDVTVKNALLDPGMEDWIPVPEAVGSVEVKAALPLGREAWCAVSAALQALALEGRIRVYRGRWNDENPRELSTSEAVAELADQRWYAFHPDDPNEERVSFVNIANIRG
jgi:hypothetical protein